MFAVGLVVLTGCATAPPAAPPQYEPAGYSSLRVDARKLEIIENWQMPMAAPYIEHTLMPNLSDMTVDWAKYVLVPVGGSGEVVLDITQASVKVTDLPQSTALLDVFSDQQDTKIRVDIKAKLMWIQPVGGKQGIVDIDASTTRTVSESSTPNTRDVAVREAMLEAIDLLDAEARRKITTIPDIIRP
ncbi:MAG: hypothetical protein VXW11_03340 [Pseudomonadota bacterium]|nr:hypothetical protein [Pseudomonadota bacterium]